MDTRFTELRILPDGGDGAPEFIWATFPLRLIIGVLPTPQGACFVMFESGKAYVTSHDYDELSGALLDDDHLWGDRLSFSEEHEAFALANVEVVTEDEDEAEDIPPVLEFFENPDGDPDEDHGYDELDLRDENGDIL